MNSMPDTSMVAAAFHRQAAEYDRHVLVQKRVVEGVVQSIESLCHRLPEQILDVGCGTGSLLAGLHALYPEARLCGVDLAFNMCLHSRHKLGESCAVVNGDAGQLAFKSGSFDLVASSSALQWVSNLSQTLHELRRVVKPNGTVCLAFFADGTLRELQDCLRDAVSSRDGEKSELRTRQHDFWTADDVLSILGGMDFEQYVVTCETETDWYDDLTSLLRSLKNIGAGTVSGRGGGLGWRGIIAETSRLYRERYGQDGKIPANYAVLYLYAKAPGVMAS